ncbi:MAG TPA: DUF1800 domain-containing protein [Candidatus Acidoferrum sp.]|nr:DUF1800 domain-containing protein [Candidatus Acidoferrum sp.]
MKPSYAKLVLPIDSSHTPMATVSLRPQALLAAFLSIACVLSLGVDVPAIAVIPAGAKDKKPKQDPVLKGLPVTELTVDEAILHAMNRLAYGPRPGDVERVRQMGLAKWIEQQLAPNSIDDKAVNARLENLPTLSMSSAHLLEEYPQPKQAAIQAAKRADAAANPNQRPAHNGATGGGKDMQNTSDASETTVASAPPSSSAAVSQSAPNNSPEINIADKTSVPVSMKTKPSPLNRDLASNLTTPGVGKRNVLSGPDPNAVPRVIADDSKKPQRVVEELAMAKVTRAIYSERQLQQVMDDFWFNHFNVYAAKGQDKWYLTSYERDVIQPHTLGKFKDLVTATAESPAMLFYLDNFLSADPNAAQRQAALRAVRQNRGRFGRPRPQPPQGPPAKKNTRGLNENYGRELMELHTLGVEGGYTQKDVSELARCFTGWTIDKPRLNPEFKFDEKLHDSGQKIVLNKKIHAGGMKDGEQAIELLARHRSTAKFISTKLARRFVSDTPPASLVARMAKTFESSDGDIRTVMHTMIYSPEFWSREAYRAKIKTPFELVISAVRALGTDVDSAMPLAQWVGRIGEPLYQCQPPTGYADNADAWVNTGALLNRLNFSLTLAGNKVRGARSDVGSLLGVDAAEPKVALERALQIFLGGQASPTTLETLQKQLDSPQVLQAKLDDPVKKVDLGVVTGLVLGAPEFQRR